MRGGRCREAAAPIIPESADRGDEDEGHVLPLSYREFLPVASEIEKPWSGYLTFGGFPQMLAGQSDADKSEYLKFLFQNVLYIKDAIRRNKIKHDVRDDPHAHGLLHRMADEHPRQDR